MFYVSFWDGEGNRESGESTLIVDVTARLKDAVEAMLLRTWDQQYVGVGRDGNGMTHKGLRVTKVWRLENSERWKRYVTCRSSLNRVEGPQGLLRVSPMEVRIRRCQPNECVWVWRW